MRLKRIPYQPDKSIKTFTHTTDTDCVRNLMNTENDSVFASSNVGNPNDKNPICTSTTKSIATQRSSSIFESRSLFKDIETTLFLTVKFINVII